LLASASLGDHPPLSQSKNFSVRSAFYASAVAAGEGPICPGLRPANTRTGGRSRGGFRRANALRLPRVTRPDHRVDLLIRKKRMNRQRQFAAGEMTGLGCGRSVFVRWQVFQRGLFRDDPGIVNTSRDFAASQMFAQRIALSFSNQNRKQMPHGARGGRHWQ